MTKIMILAFSLGLSISTSASAKLYKWVDEQKITHYSETIPPQYSNRNRIELNKGKSSKLIIVDSTLQQKQRAEDLKKEAKTKADQEQLRHDKALLATYNSKQEIDLAYQRRFDQVQNQLHGQQQQIKIIEAKLETLHQEEQRYIQHKKSLPGSLQDDLDENQERLNLAKTQLEKTKNLELDVQQKHQSDLSRYILLTTPRTSKP